MLATLQGPFGPIAVTTPNFTIGHASDNQLVLSDPNISLHHALIRIETQNSSIIDLGSANGTYVNEQRIEQNRARLLRTGDTIRIGNTTFRYEASQRGSFADYPPPPPYIPNTPIHMRMRPGFPLTAIPTAILIHYRTRYLHCPFHTPYHQSLLINGRCYSSQLQPSSFWV